MDCAVVCAQNCAVTCYLNCNSDCRNNCYDACTSGCVNGCSATSRYGTDAAGSNTTHTSVNANQGAGDTLPQQGAQAQPLGNAS
jgi:hypothetical protein